MDIIFTFLLGRKDVNKRVLLKKIILAKFFVLGKKGNKIVGFGCFKKPSKETKRILNDLDIFPQKITRKTCLENGFFFVDPQYRGLGIASHIQKILLDFITPYPILSITKTSNIAMQKILAYHGFIPVGKPYINNFLQQEVQIYLYSNKI